MVGAQGVSPSHSINDSEWQRSLNATIERKRQLSALATPTFTNLKMNRAAQVLNPARLITYGGYLCEAKVRPSPPWLPWLAKHCVISERTAQLYVKLAKKRTTIEKEQIRNDVADLTLNEERGLLDRTIIKIATEQSREVFQYAIGS